MTLLDLGIVVITRLLFIEMTGGSNTIERVPGANAVPRVSR